MLTISFTKATLAQRDTIFSWLGEPHMKEFWDNSQEHKEDILDFMHGRKQAYLGGGATYWVGSLGEEPFCFILTHSFSPDDEDLPALYKTHLSARGHTMGLDFGIGNKNFIGKGLAAPTLEAFCDFIRKGIDPLVDTFLIDPDEHNPRAKRVYEKAGFKKVETYEPSKGAFQGHKTYLMIKQV